MSFGGTVEIAREDYVRYWKDETVSNVAVVLHDPSQVEEVRQIMLDRWGQSSNLIVRSNQEFWAEIRSYYDSFYGLIDGLTWIATLVAGLAIANTLFSNILERKREFGILRAVGTRRREVTWIVLGEALSTGLVGAAFGIAGGLLTQMMFVAAAELINGTSIDLVFSLAPAVQAIVVALILAPLAGLVPARWAARLDIVDALRYE